MLCLLALLFPSALSHPSPSFYSFFFNDTATTEIYTLSLHDALPISLQFSSHGMAQSAAQLLERIWNAERSEEHTSELQSHLNLVCRLLLEKKKRFLQRRRLCHTCVLRAFAIIGPQYTPHRGRVHSPC